MFDFIRKVFGGREPADLPKDAASKNIPIKKASAVSDQTETTVITQPKKIPSGEFVVILQEDGLLPERVAETISRLMGVDMPTAEKLTQSAPVVLLDGVAETPAHKMQRELQMFGAVVDVSRGSGVAKEVVDETAVVLPPDPVPESTTKSADSVITTHIFQVFLSSLGKQPELVVKYIRSLLNDYESLGAVRWQIQMKMERVLPLVFGRTLDDANGIAAELNALGATAVVFRGNDPNKPKYDHDQYGLVLVDIGSNQVEVVSLVAEMLDLDHGKAERAISKLPLILLENVAAKKAIVMGERFNALGARCDVPGPEKQVWLDPSTDHIQKKPGDFHVILHRVGSNNLIVRLTINNLRPDLSVPDAEQLMVAVPQVLWTDIDLETAELVKLKLEDFGATIVIQPAVIALKIDEMHPQNPNFVAGNYDLVLTEFDRMRRIFLIKKLRDLLPGSRLTELVALLEMVPTVIVTGVDRETAIGIQASLAEAGGVVTISKEDA